MEQIILMQLELFARAGGGGSSSGSGGDSGGGIEGIAALGFIPAYFVGGRLRRSLGQTQTGFVVSNAVGFGITLIAAVFIVRMGWVGWLIAGGALAGMASGLYGLGEKIKTSKFVQNNLKQAASKDAAWNEDRLIEHARQTFIRYQEDWSNQNSESIKQYTTENYGYHAGLMIYTLQLMHRRNKMQNIKLHDVAVTAMHDAANNNQDSVTIGFSASAEDRLLENNQTLFVDKSDFTEYWRFRRSDDQWLLDGVDQATASAAVYNPQIEEFARDREYCYSADMGWLFIPKRGQLFSGAQFGSSDINNHVVGLYNDTLLVQLYTYVKAEKVKPVVVAQINVPKEYGQIVVRRKKKLRFGIRGLERVEMEWGQFNEQYEVFASNTDQATSFELLHPTYMEQLMALDFNVSIEVVDNVIYLYTDERGSDSTTYHTMYDLVQKAFKELRL